MKCSVCIATHNKPGELHRTLDSIFSQKPDFEFEVIVVCDGSAAPTLDVCNKFSDKVNFEFTWQENPSSYRNPCFARNKAMRMAKGEVLILQSDDVIHAGPETISTLCQFDLEKEFLVASVWNKDMSSGNVLEQYTGFDNPRELFFLGSVARKHVYAIGGNSEDFTEPGYDDDWFGKCLLFGPPKLQCVFTSSVVGWHQNHARPDLGGFYGRMKTVFDEKMRAAQADPSLFVGGDPWPTS